jgi:hypothetical protein
MIETFTENDSFLFYRLNLLNVKLNSFDWFLLVCKLLLYKYSKSVCKSKDLFTYSISHNCLFYFL